MALHSHELIQTFYLHINQTLGVGYLGRDMTLVEASLTSNAGKEGSSFTLDLLGLVS